MKNKRILKGKVSTTKILAFGFLTAIILGGLILMLPISSADGSFSSITDAFFTSTTSVCVTGLVTVQTYAHWNVFGQIVITILSQIGGLGVITFTTLFFMMLGKKITLKDRLVLMDAYNLDSMEGLSFVVKRIVKGTLVVELVGALIYMTVFIPEFGISGIWKSIFNAIAAFCNSGMDILGPDSLAPYVSNPIVSINTMLLIVVGGIGFPIWWSTIELIKIRRKSRHIFKMRLLSIPLHNKIVLFSTFALILSGAILVFVLEYGNPNTLGNLSIGEKIQAAFFQSITTRTAGFYTISQSGLCQSTATICCILMFIGGSPAGTAGGVKTTTIFVLLATTIAIIKGKKDTEIFHRKIKDDTVRSAISIFSVSFVILIIAVVALTITENGNMLDSLYEATSAIATVGLTRDYTTSLSLIGKWIIIITMYLGRIGPISIALLFNTSKKPKLIRYPKEDVHVG